MASTDASAVPAALPAGSMATVSLVSALAGPITRTWSVHHNARLFIVQLTHNTITGERALAVDGAEQPGTAGRSTIFSSAANLVFSCGDKAGVVAVRNQGHVFEYTCTFDDRPVPEDNSVLSTSASSDDGLNRLKLSVDGYVTATDEAGKPVTWFAVRTVRENDERETIVHRRFNNFVALNDVLRGAYTGSHILASFPDLPPRGFFWEVQNTPEFLEKRRFGLSEWMHKISHIPRMRLNPEFLAFVGIVEGSREVSVVFPTPALGVTLKDTGTGFTEVSAIKPLPTGEPSPAQASGLVFPGYQISKIAGENVLGDSYEVIVAKLKATPRPMMVHVIGSFPALVREDSAAYAKVPVAAAPAPASTEDTAITGLIGGGVSFIGTGATPKPAHAPARAGVPSTVDTSGISAGGTGSRGAADGTDDGGIVGGMAGVV